MFMRCVETRPSVPSLSLADCVGGNHIKGFQLHVYEETTFNYKIFCVNNSTFGLECVFCWLSAFTKISDVWGDGVHPTVEMADFLILTLTLKLARWLPRSDVDSEMLSYASRRHPVDSVGLKNALDSTANQLLLERDRSYERHQMCLCSDSALIRQWSW